MRLIERDYHGLSMPSHSEWVAIVVTLVCWFGFFAGFLMSSNNDSGNNSNDSVNNSVAYGALGAAIGCMSMALIYGLRAAVKHCKSDVQTTTDTRTRLLSGNNSNSQIWADDSKHGSQSKIVSVAGVVFEA